MFPNVRSDVLYGPNPHERLRYPTNSATQKLDKLSGIYLIVNSLLPFILVIVPVGTGYSFWQKIGSAFDEYDQAITTIIRQAKIAKAAVEKMINELNRQADLIKRDGEEIVNRVNKAAQQVSDAIRNFETAFSAPFKNVPDYLGGKMVRRSMESLGRAVKKPFAPLGNQIKAMGRDIQNIDDRLEAITRKIVELRTVKVYLEIVAEEYQKLLTTLRTSFRAVSDWVKAIAIGLAFLFLWSRLGYGLWVRERVLRGLDRIKGVVFPPAARGQ